MKFASRIGPSWHTFAFYHGAKGLRRCVADPRTQHVTKLILDSIYAEPICPGAKEVFGDCPLAQVGAKAVGIIRDRRRRKRRITG